MTEQEQQAMIAEQNTLRMDVFTLRAALEDAHRTLMHLRSGGYFNRMNHADEMIARKAESHARDILARFGAE
jgi:hypothetical protein